MRPIASVLIDFNREASRPRIVHSAIHVEPVPELVSEPAIDLEDLTRDAESRGYARGREDAILECQEREQGAAAASAEELENRLIEARQLWAEAEGLKLADLMDARFQELQDRIGDQVASVLMALVRPALQQQVLRKIQNALETFTRQDSNMLLQVHGPADLIEEIRRSLAGRVRSIDLIADDGVDVRITANDTEIESHLGALLSETEADAVS